MEFANLPLQQQARQLRRQELTQMITAAFDWLAESLRKQHEGALRRANTNRRLRSANGTPA